MKLVKEFLCDNTPTDSELIESLKIVESENCVVKLKWFVKWSGWYRLLIRSGMTLEDCKSKLPKVYGM